VFETATLELRLSMCGECSHQIRCVSVTKECCCTGVIQKDGSSSSRTYTTKTTVVRGLRGRAGEGEDGEVFDLDD
jgi:hypothetical protein